MAADSNSTEFFIVHGVLDAPASGIDIRVLDPNNSNMPSQVLADDINYEEMTAYHSLQPAVYNIDAINFSGSPPPYDVYRFDLSLLRGKTFTLILSGFLAPQPGDSSFTLVGFEARAERSRQRPGFSLRILPRGQLGLYHLFDCVILPPS